MLKNICYSIPKDKLAWQNALNSVANLLPTGIRVTDVQKLHDLPIFALVVVLKNDILNAKSDLVTSIQAWADKQPNWQLVLVQEDTEANFIQVNLPTLSKRQEKSQTVSDVSVYRYLLIPTTETLMTPERKTAAAHVIDEQITAHLRHFLDQVATNDSQNAITNPHVDCHILPIGHILSQHKLACFDMDSTLIEQEVIVELAKKADIGEKVNEITQSAMRGEIDFDTSFAKRLALLEGLSTDVLDEIKESLTLSAGASVTIATLKALGYHTVLLSGGFVYFAEYVAKQLGIDEVHANVLDIEQDKVTGFVQLPIVNGERKAELVKRISHRLGIESSQVVCVGDGANDLPMMALADLGLAYKAKPIVQAKADVAINTTGLDGVLYALGYPLLKPC